MVSQADLKKIWAALWPKTGAPPPSYDAHIGAFVCTLLIATKLMHVTGLILK
jgi:hypothetical protein